MDPIDDVEPFRLDPATALVGAQQGDAVRLIVHGEPATQAGTQSVPTGKGRRQITTGGKNLLPWRQAIAAVASQHVDEHGGFGETAVQIDMTFRFPMPHSRPKHARVTGVAFHRTRRDDLDKLERAVLDALTFSRIIDDDGFVVRLSSEKIELTAGPGRWTGVEIWIRPAVLDLAAAG